MRSKILGPPGTGKTTAVLQCVRDYLDKEPELKIGVCSFTVSAKEEVRQRLTKLGVILKDHPTLKIQTIHSFAFEYMNFKRSYMINTLSKFAQSIGQQSKLEDRNLGFAGKSELEKAIGHYQFCRSLMEKHGLHCPSGVSPSMLAEYIRAFELYKDSENLLDYNDVLERYHRDGGPLDFDVMVVDEAQDLSVIQWKVLQTMTETCRDTIVAGDDDQTIYAFAGVNVKHFINWKADEVRVLSQSFRLPGPIHEYSMDALSMIEHRMEKEFRPAPHKGNVFVTNEIDPINDIVPYESCAILHRNGYIAAEIRQKLNRLLIPYLGKGSPYNRRTPLKAIKLWEDWRAGKPLEVHNLWTISKYLGPAIENFDKREKADRQSKAYECPYKDIPWYIALKMDSLPLYKCVYDTYGLKVLTDTPRLTVTTIHQAKGGEWDKVIVLTDVSTATYEQFKNGSEADRDAEARVWYVALTRARKCLQIIRPHTHKFYPLKGVT